MTGQIDFERHVRAAQGYVELGMFLEADAELEEIDDELRQMPAALAVRATIYYTLKKWELLLVVARQLAIEQPENPQWCRSWAEATRQTVSVDAARNILLEAVERHPKDGATQYNLACYECLLGEMETAKARLDHAFELDSSLRLAALTDPDLERLWSAL